MSLRLSHTNLKCKSWYIRATVSRVPYTKVLILLNRTVQLCTVRCVQYIFKFTSNRFGQLLISTLYLFMISWPGTLDPFYNICDTPSFFFLLHGGPEQIHFWKERLNKLFFPFDLSRNTRCCVFITKLKYFYKFITGFKIVNTSSC